MADSTERHFFHLSLDQMRKFAESYRLLLAHFLSRMVSEERLFSLSGLVRL